MDALDVALAEVQDTEPTWNRGQFANHVPMVVETLAHLGRSDAIEDWLRPVRSRYADAASPSELIRDWHEALGQQARYADWRAFFIAAIDAEPWQGVVDTWCGRLARGSVGHLFHGLIRVAHAVRGLNAEETEARRRELGNALAYWASAYEELPGDVPPAPSDLALVHSATETYLRDAAGFPIYSVHGVTGAMAAARLSRTVGEESAELLGSYAAEACAWIETILEARPVDDVAELLRPDELVTAAIANGGEHAIKLAETCIEADRLSGDPIYLAAAADGLTRFVGG